MQLILFKSIIRIINTFFKPKSIKRVITTFTKVLIDRIKLFRVIFRTFRFRVKIRRKITKKNFFVQYFEYSVQVIYYSSKKFCT